MTCYIGLAFAWPSDSLLKYITQSSATLCASTSSPRKWDLFQLRSLLNNSKQP